MGKKRTVAAAFAGILLVCASVSAGAVSLSQPAGFSSWFEIPVPDAEIEQESGFLLPVPSQNVDPDFALIYGETEEKVSIVPVPGTEPSEEVDPDLPEGGSVS